MYTQTDERTTDATVASVSHTRRRRLKLQSAHDQPNHPATGAIVLPACRRVFAVNGSSRIEIPIPNKRLLIALSIGCHSTQNSFSFGSVKNLSATVKGEVHGLIDPVYFPTSLGTPHGSLKGRGRNPVPPSPPSVQTTLARICGLTFIFYSVLCSCGLSLLPNPNLTILFLSSVSHTG